MKKEETPQVRLAYLFQLFIAKKATTAQRDELMLLMADADREEEVNSLLKEYWDAFDPEKVLFTELESDALLDRMLQSPGLTSTHRRPGPRWRRYRWEWLAAASLLLFITVGTYLAVRQQFVTDKVSEKPIEDVEPGREKAMLTLSSGRKIALDDAPVGILAEQGPIKISKAEDGALIYNVTTGGQSPHPDEADEYNTISTPRGGRYKVVLPDGTRVWLNAATTLRYPTRFGNKVRRVELTGEAYLEVNSVGATGAERGSKVPFQVASGHQLVEVLGTHFNINSYADEKIAKTTLLEGRIRITNVNKGNKMKLIPGQQCSISQTGELQLLKHVDLEEAVAWKDDIFSFKSSDIQSVMRQIARWYNVDVSYEGSIPDEHLTGYISRKVPISRVVKMLEQTSDLKFRIEGRKLVVMNSKHHKNIGT